MSSAFPNALRSGRAPIVMGQTGAGAITFRVESAELWDAVRVSASPDASAAAVKERALAAFFPKGELAGDYVLKFRGWEILDENASLRDVGITEGSIILLAVRRRQPVR